MDFTAAFASACLCLVSRVPRRAEIALEFADPSLCEFELDL
jgi:hypothetical protein